MGPRLQELIDEKAWAVSREPWTITLSYRTAQCCTLQARSHRPTWTNNQLFFQLPPNLKSMALLLIVPKKQIPESGIWKQKYIWVWRITWIIIELAPG